MMRKECRNCRFYKARPFRNIHGDVFDGYCKKNELHVTAESVCVCIKLKAT